MTKEKKKKIILLVILSVFSIAMITTAVITKMDFTLIITIVILSATAISIIISTLLENKDTKPLESINDNSTKKKAKTSELIEEQKLVNIQPIIEIQESEESQKPIYKESKNLTISSTTISTKAIQTKKLQQSTYNSNTAINNNNIILILNIIKYILFAFFSVNMILTIVFYFTIILVYFIYPIILVAGIELLFAIYIERKIQNIKQIQLLNQILENININKD